MKKELPLYNTHARVDWSGVYYGDALLAYFTLPSNEYRTGHWYSCFVFKKPHPLIDVMLFYINKDAGEIREDNDPDGRKVIRFALPKKLNLKIVFKRIFYLKNLKECEIPLTFKNIVKFLKWPTYCCVVII